MRYMASTDWISTDNRHFFSLDTLQAHWKIPVFFQNPVVQRPLSCLPSLAAAAFLTALVLFSQLNPIPADQSDPLYPAKHAKLCPVISPAVQTAFLR